MRWLSVISVALVMFTSQSQLARAVDPVPCSCLQELWVDYPGPYDLYFSLDHMTSCSDECQEALSYGSASNSTLPQICEHDNCEEFEGPDQRAAGIFPRHGQEL